MDDLVVPTRNGRSPDMVLGQDVADGYGKVAAAKATQSDVDSLGRGCACATAEDAFGRERRDYQIPLKNADGTLTRKAYEMIEMHQPSLRIESEVAQVVQSKIVKETLVREDGSMFEVVAGSARQMSDAQGLKPVRHYGRWSERTIFHGDGSRTILRRLPGRGVVSERIEA